MVIPAPETSSTSTHAVHSRAVGDRAVSRAKAIAIRTDWSPFNGDALRLNRTPNWQTFTSLPHPHDGKAGSRDVTACNSTEPYHDKPTPAGPDRVAKLSVTDTAASTFEVESCMAEVAIELAALGCHLALGSRRSCGSPCGISSVASRALAAGAAACGGRATIRRVWCRRRWTGRARSAAGCCCAHEIATV